MKYHEIELKEITESQLFNPPETMLVWNDESGKLFKLEVLAIVKGRQSGFPVIAESEAFRHCAKIPIVLATNRELARWLAEGKGEVMSCGNVPEVRSSLSYDSTAENEPVAGKIIVRKWIETDWHIPTREYLGLEDK